MLFIIIDVFLIGLPFIYYLNNIKNEKAKIKEKARMIFENLGLTKLSSQSFFNALLLLVLLLAFSFLLEFALNFFDLNDIEKAYEIIRSIKANYWLIAYILIVRVTAEEIFFRGFLVKETGIIISSILFSLMHVFYYSFAELLGSLILGLVLATFYAKRKDLYANIAAHAIYNLYLFASI